MSNGYTFTKRSAERITRVVRDVERGGRDQPPVYFRRPLDDGDPVRLGKTTEAWLRGTESDIEIWNQGTPLSEEVSDPAVTVTAYNKMYDVAEGVWVLIALAENGKWYLVEAATPDQSESGCRATNISGHDLTTISGYNEAATQLLGHENGCLKWFDVCECEAGS